MTLHSTEIPAMHLSHLDRRSNVHYAPAVNMNGTIATTADEETVVEEEGSKNRCVYNRITSGGMVVANCACTQGDEESTTKHHKVGSSMVPGERVCFSIILFLLLHNDL